MKLALSAVALALSLACSAQEQRMNIGVGAGPSIALNVAADKTTMSGLTGHINYYTISKKGLVRGIGINAAQLSVGNIGTLRLNGSDYKVLNRDNYANPALTLMGFLGHEIRFGSSSVMFGGRGGVFYGFQKYGGLGFTAGAGGGYTLHFDEYKAAGISFYPHLYYVRTLQSTTTREANAVFLSLPVTINYYITIPTIKKKTAPGEDEAVE